ncbi:hypothetical protein SAMN05660462_01888 [Proteiniborus ethanoligenes]|uniref:Uncharacterized protein n=1 Tax=Proteiniborus ethanoligenes TaxID=415015 RepID=A0A1H3QCW6_9FIRM|nr:hypothetical protein [Proteiniborus ethanoligenes]SDZ10875.1 hypothetical protein SAMN05660462_01888 [Proteiniborus ethanoligenes]
MDADPHGNSFSRKINNNVEEGTFLSLIMCSSTIEGGEIKYGKGFRTN